MNPIHFFLALFLALFLPQQGLADFCRDQNILCQGAFRDSSLTLHQLLQEPTQKWVPPALLDGSVRFDSVVNSLIFISASRTRAYPTEMPGSGFRLVLDCDGKHLHINEPSQTTGPVWERFLATLKRALEQAIPFDQHRSRFYRPAFSSFVIYTVALGGARDPYRNIDQNVEWKLFNRSRSGGLAAMGTSEIPNRYISTRCFPATSQEAAPQAQHIALPEVVPSPTPGEASPRSNPALDFSAACGQIMQANPPPACMRSRRVALDWVNSHPEFIPPPIPEYAPRSFFMTSVGLYCQNPRDSQPSSSCDRARQRMQAETARLRRPDDLVANVRTDNLPDLTVIEAWQRACHSGPRLDWCLNAYRNLDLAH